MELEDTTSIVFYTTQEHLNPTIALTKLINKHMHPSISITIISTGPESFVPKTPSTTYCRLNAVNLPENFSTYPIELFFEIPRLLRTKEVGFVINTWAPQKEVLSHDAVGSFVTHCGWNSVLEAVSFGVPMIGWPLYAEQRMNRVFMVEEMKVALALDEEENGFVTAVELEKRVRELMESVKGKGVRWRVAKLKISAKRAVSKGGSSLIAFEKFINWEKILSTLV